MDILDEVEHTDGAHQGTDETTTKKLPPVVIDSKIETKTSEGQAEARLRKESQEKDLSLKNQIGTC